MADIHIDDFCRDSARILLALYNNFPRRSAVYVEDISGPDEPDEVGLHSTRYMACLGTMVWLSDEKYLRYESLIYQDGIDQAVLTNKAFVLLSAVCDLRFEEPSEDLPLSISLEKLSMVAQIRSALRSGSSEKISAIMRYFFSRVASEVLSPPSARIFMSAKDQPDADA